MKQKILKVHQDNPAYGHKRLAMELKIGKNRALRIMHKYNIKPPRRKAKSFYTTRSVNNCSYTNLIINIIPSRPCQIYCSDLTYIKFHGQFVYLGTCQDIYTKQIMSAEISTKHDQHLAYQVVKESFKKGIPEIFHFDQGKENMADKVTGYIEGKGVAISVSDKGSPWQNGYQESFFSRFKDENGDLNRFDSMGYLIEEIYSYIKYYNSKRIHTSLKTSPLKFKQAYVESVH